MKRRTKDTNMMFIWRHMNSLQSKQQGIEGIQDGLEPALG